VNDASFTIEVQCPGRCYVSVASIGAEWYYIFLLVCFIVVGVLRVKLQGGRRSSAFGKAHSVPLFADGKCPNCGQRADFTGNTCVACGWHFDKASLPSPKVTPTMGVIQRGIVLDGTLAFHKGQVVSVEREDPDPRRPEFRYVVQSEALGKRYLLSTSDLFI
jgi:hypothetical protein